jgi:arabinofuranosyltransferase
MDAIGLGQAGSDIEAKLAKRWLLLMLLMPALMFAAHALMYAGYVADDSYISFRYAQNLLEGHGLVWNPGTAADARVEGYSNPLWVLLLALLGGLGLDLVSASRVLGLGCALGAMGFVFGLGRSVARIGAAGEDGRLGGREALHALLAGFAGALALAYSTPIAIWAMGGLEGSLVALGLAWALWDSFAAMRLVRDGDEARGLRRARRAGIGLALLVWTRPDGALFGLSMALGYLVGCGWRLGWRMTWRSAGYPVAALVLLTGLRLVYYGEWLPNTAHVKAEFSFEAFRLGGEYVLSGLGWLGAGVVGALLSLGFDRERRAYAAALLFHMLLTCLYVAAIQGDFFPGRRQLLPLALLGAVGVGLFTAHPVNRLMRFFLSFAPAGLLIMWLIYGVNGDPQAQRARKEFWVRDSIALGEQLQQMFGEERPVLAVEAAGALPFAVDFECIDMLGLNDRHIARLDARSGAIPGHNHADGGYVIGREPDLIGFLSPPMMLVSAYPSWFDLTVLPEFAEGYRPFAVQVPGRKDTVLWVRYLGRLGVRERGEGAGYRYEIPPYLFGAPDPMPAVANGILSTELLSAVVLPWMAKPDVLAVVGGRVGEGAGNAGEGAVGLLQRPIAALPRCGLAKGRYRAIVDVAEGEAWVQANPLALDLQVRDPRLGEPFAVSGPDATLWLAGRVGSRVRSVELRRVE